MYKTVSYGVCIQSLSDSFTNLVDFESKRIASNSFCYLCVMVSDNVTREDMWSMQQINPLDVDYDFWDKQRESIRQMSRITNSCIFTVDVFKGRYDFASENMADIFGYNPAWLKKIEMQGDLLEEHFHPDDRAQLIHRQIDHSRFIYSLPFENRNDYSQIFQFRMRNRKQEYINVISRQRVIQKDKNGKAWIVMGIMDIAPDQTPSNTIKCTVLNLKTGDTFNPLLLSSDELLLSNREKEILLLIQKGLLSKEIAGQLGISIYTVNNHRKTILSKLNADNAIEAINQARTLGLLH